MCSQHPDVLLLFHSVGARVRLLWTYTFSQLTFFPFIDFNKQLQLMYYKTKNRKGGIIQQLPVTSYFNTGKKRRFSIWLVKVADSFLQKRLPANIT